MTARFGGAGATDGVPNALGQGMTLKELAVEAGQLEVETLAVFKEGDVEEPDAQERLNASRPRRWRA